MDRSSWVAGIVLVWAVLLAGCSGSDSADRPARDAPPPPLDMQLDTRLDTRLAATLAQHGFTGKVEGGLESRLGRKIDPRLADIGRLLFFDRVSSLHNDNACAGCHSPTNGFGDTQSIAIGIQSNGLVGPHRAGPRNQRRTP